MLDPMRKRAVAGLKIGDSFTISRTFSRQETEQFGDLTRDYNPVHYDMRWAHKKNFPGLICHGLLVGSMICEIGGQIGWLASGMTFKFMKPVFFGDTITCTTTLQQFEDDGRAIAEAKFVNEKGEQVCHAVLTGRLPLAHERELLEIIEEEHSTP
jgi:acyl dehydratase